MEYPWFNKVSDDELMQGDLIDDCPLFVPPVMLAHKMTANATMTVEERDVIIITQSCDMVKGREKVDDVLLCPVFQQSEMEEVSVLQNLSDLENVDLNQIC